MSEEMVLPRRDGMQRFWRLNGTGLDESGNGATLTLTNVPYKTTYRDYQSQCGTFNGTSSNGTNATTISAARTIFFAIYPTSNTKTVLTATGITVTINSSSQISTSGLTGVTAYVNGAETNALTLNAWNFVFISHDSANYASFNFGANSFAGDAQCVGTFNRVLSVTEIRNWQLSFMRQLGGSSLYPLVDGLVGYLDSTDGNELSDIVSGNGATKTSGTATTDNLGFTKAIANPNYTFPSITYTNVYSFENSGSGWGLVANPSGISATALNRTTTFRLALFFNRALSSSEQTAISDLLKKQYVLPFDALGRNLPQSYRNNLLLHLSGDYSGTTAYDASATSTKPAYNGTLVNAPTPKRRYGFKGFSFNGTSQYLKSLPNLRGVNNFRISATVKTTDVASYRAIYSVSYTVTSGEYWVLRISNTGKLQFSDQVANVVDSNTTLVSGRTYKIDFVRKSANSFAFYIDGVLDKAFTMTVTSATQTIAGDTGPFLGVTNTNVGQYWKGEILNFRIYSENSESSIQSETAPFFIP